jgi:hypothetical protein
MCTVCETAMAKVDADAAGSNRNLYWERTEAAIAAWRKTLPDDAEFDGVMEETAAWCAHMEENDKGAVREMNS